MTAEQFKIRKRVLNDMERAYELTISDINRYKRQAGSITIDVIKRLINWNYFENKDAVDFWTYESDYYNTITVAMDMFDLHLWLVKKYDVDNDILDDMEEALNYNTTITIPKEFLPE